MGKILIQTNEMTKEPELYYLRLPKDINKYKVFLMDATVATGWLIFIIYWNHRKRPKWAFFWISNIWKF